MTRLSLQKPSVCLFHPHLLLINDKIFTPVLKMRLLCPQGCPGTGRKWFFFLFLKRENLGCFLSPIPFHLLALTLTDRSVLRRTHHTPRASFSEYRAKTFRLLKWYKDFWSSWGLGQQVCLLRSKRICFACAGDLDSTLCSYLHAEAGSCTSGTWV